MPFSTLYRNGKVEGRFPLEMPPILLGYDKDDQSPSQGLAPASALALFVTIEPALPPPKESERERLSAHDVKMQEYAAQWTKSLLSHLPREARFERHLRVFAPAEDGERTLVCKYVRPQPPPDEENGGFPAQMAQSEQARAAPMRPARHLARRSRPDLAP